MNGVSTSPLPNEALLIRYKGHVIGYTFKQSSGLWLGLSTIIFELTNEGPWSSVVNLLVNTFEDRLDK